MPNYGENVSQRTPCLLVLDASASMGAVEAGRTRISLLNDGIAAFDADLKADEIAMARVQIGAINVGGFSSEPQMFLDWTDAMDFQPFPMVTGYNTPLGAATLLGLEVIEAQKSVLKSHGISYNRPWMLILTDGAPTDDDATWREACRRAREAETRGRVLIFPVCVGDVDLNKIAELTITPPKKMNGLQFRELFLWLSESVREASKSAPGSTVQFAPTDRWAGTTLS